MADVTVKVTDLTGAVDMAARSRDLRPVFLGPIRADMLATEAAIFQNAGGVAGVDRWPPLTEATMERKTAQGQASSRILVDRGDLERSLTQPGADGQIAEVVGKTKFRFGTQITNDRGEMFAHYHQLGTTTMLKRQIMPDIWPEAGTDRWANMIADYITGERE